MNNDLHKVLYKKTEHKKKKLVYINIQVIPINSVFHILTVESDNILLWTASTKNKCR